MGCFVQSCQYTFWKTGIHSVDFKGIKIIFVTINYKIATQTSNNYT